MVSSDLLDHEYEISILNNYKNLDLPERFSSFNIKVIDNEARPDFSTGHLSRSWNQGIILGFKNLKNPDADYVILSQNDIEVSENWISRLLEYHQKYDFILFGDGDALQSMNVESVKKVGLYDERFCGIAYHESDYQIRQILLNRERCSINDIGRKNTHNPIYPRSLPLVSKQALDIKQYYFYKGGEDVIKWSQSGAQRSSIHHSKSYKYHSLASEFIRKKWFSAEKKIIDKADSFEKSEVGKKLQNIMHDQKGNSKGWAPSYFEGIEGDPTGWMAELLSTGKLKCVNPQPVVYPYFELDIDKLYEKCYAKYPTMIYNDLQQMSDEKIGVVHREMLSKKYYHIPLKLILNNKEVNFIKQTSDTENANLGSGGCEKEIMDIILNNEFEMTSQLEKARGDKTILFLGNANIDLVKACSKEFEKVYISNLNSKSGEKYSDLGLDNLEVVVGKSSLTFISSADIFDTVFVSHDFLMTIPTCKMRNLFLLDVRRILKPYGAIVGTYGHGPNLRKRGSLEFLSTSIIPEGYFELSDPVLMITELCYAGLLENTACYVSPKVGDPYSAYVAYKSYKQFACAKKAFLDNFKMGLEDTSACLARAYQQVFSNE